ncbi:inositol monophosphatase family protein [Herbidospora sp. NBRC 101105]|uniref:inositol monophosphatase family protein n=1 Tax=Herbidospora sp. NBRC 101105 TaxID=3032195 RepID=UPI0024A4DB56|nr:inositol monophosphatase family protein [Herbidospora sp. NBRC 101105]GLX95929.1 phosphatase [Herbidospora sp. NBRC 101105]
MSLSDAELAVAAAEAGAAVVRSLYGKPVPRYDKTSVDFATQADLEAEQAILDVIREHRPDDAFLGEETGLSGASDRTWMVDPLCGTLNFAAQTPLIAVNVALRAAGRDVAAAAADPISGEVFWTDGVRAQVDDQPLTPSPDSKLVDFNLDPPYGDLLSVIAAPGFAERFSPRVMSTSLACFWVAAGRRAAYLSDGDKRDSVHFAAALAVCRTAGCVVTDLKGRPFETGEGLLVAADRATHEALLGMILLGR